MVEGRGSIPTEPVSADLLPRLFRLDRETGDLYWLERTPDLFPNDRHPEGRCGTFNKQFAGKLAFTALNKGYRVGRIYDRICAAHRVVFALVHGRWPTQPIDHIDGNPGNNRPDNLRECPQAVNAKNCKLGSNNRSGVVGVRYMPESGRWPAQIKHNYQAQYLGSFATKEEAVAARRAAETRLGFHANHGRAA